MKKSNTALLAVLMVAMITSFGVSQSISQVTDYDGNKYKTVVIGNQEWMAENLNVEHYRNGDVIPQVQSNEDWADLKTGAWCYYENKTSNEKTYGKLYNWYAVNDYCGLAPEGWHIPSDAEWTQLTDYLGGYKAAGGKLKATTLWTSPNTEAINSSGFTAFPGGLRDFVGSFTTIGESGWFWSSSKYYTDSSWLRRMVYGSSNVHLFVTNKGEGLSVRCVRD